MTAFERKTDQAEEALDNRSSAFHITSVGNLMLPIAEEIAALEAAAWQVFDSRFLSNSTGNALDLLGGVVGEGDRGDSEDAQKLRIALKLRAYLSKKGRRNDYTDLFGLLTGADYAIPENFPGWAEFVQNDALLHDSTSLWRLLESASADGVLVRLVSNEVAAAPFTWGSEDGAITGGEWNSEDGAEVGDPWQGVRVP